LNPNVVVPARCASCDRSVELECRRPDGFWVYDSYNEYICPHCQKHNVALCPGTIVSARGTMGALA
jgi:hypothetical protein